MTKGLTNRAVLDKIVPVELVLELLSFSGGENTIGEDQELENNEARTIKNWEAISIGGMKRSKGLSEVADGGATYTLDMDLVAHHWEGSNTEVYGIIEGDLVIKSSADLNQEDAAVFTSGLLSHAVSAGDKLWITNATDNLQYKTIGNVIATPTTVPTNPCARIYEHASLFRLIAEGDSANTVYGSKPGSGTWAGAGGWTTANSAWSMVMPDVTRGCAPGFPSGTDLAVFTEFDVYVIYNQPNIARRRVANGIGCGAPLSIARGNEGIFFFSTFPTKGIFLWNGIQFINLTEKHNFIDDVNLSQRIFGVYRDRTYYFIYNETGSGVTYPNRIKKYDTLFGRWMERPVNIALSDNLGYPTLLTRDSNELYIGSSLKDKLYELDDSSTSDNSNDTQAVYTTKIFTSRDFDVASGGGRFPIDGVKIKITKVTVTYKGNVGVFSIAWDFDRALHVGQQTFNLDTGVGDLINTTFIVNTSFIQGESLSKTAVKTFNNSAVGKAVQFQILQSGQGTRPEIKKIKIFANAIEEE